MTKQEKEAVKNKLYKAGMEDAVHGWAPSEREYGENEHYLAGFHDGIALLKEKNE